MIRRPPRSTLDRSSAASDVYKRQELQRPEGSSGAGSRLLRLRPVPVLGRGQPRRFLAVSYTHLRAHETVLDLVCRLLLEKKQEEHQWRSRASRLTLPLRRETGGINTDYVPESSRVRTY